MFIYVTKVRVIPPYALDLDFSNGMRRRVNLVSRLDRPIYLPLRDLAYFAKAYLDEDSLTVAWPNGADFSPDYLLNRAPAHTTEAFRLIADSQIQSGVAKFETRLRTSTVDELKAVLVRAPQPTRDTMPSRITPVPEVFERFFEFELSASGDAQAPVTKEAEPGRIRQTDEYIVAPAIAGATG